MKIALLFWTLYFHRVCFVIFYLTPGWVSWFWYNHFVFCKHVVVELIFDENQKRTEARENKSSILFLFSQTLYLDFILVNESLFVYMFRPVLKWEHWLYFIDLNLPFLIIKPNQKIGIFVEHSGRPVDFQKLGLSLDSKTG